MQDHIPNINIDFQVLFESVPGLYLVLQPDSPRFTILSVNDAYLQATMTKREKIIGRGLFEVFPDNPNDPAATGTSNLRKSLEQVLGKKVAHTMAIQKYDIPHPESGEFEERYWSPLNKPVLDSQNKVVYIIHRVEDVTAFLHLEQKGIEQNVITEQLRTRTGEMEIEINQRAQEIKEMNHHLRTANEQIQTMFSNAPTGVILIDSEGKIVQWNPKAEIIFGWKHIEVIEKYFHQIIIPERFREAHLKGIKDFLKTGQGFVVNEQIELTALRKDNTEFAVGINISPTLIKGNYFFIGFITDITESKKVEKALKDKAMQLDEAQQLAHMGSWEWDILANKIKWSDELYRLYGFTPQEFEANYEDFLNFIHPCDREHVNSIVQKSYKDKQSFQFFYRIIHKDGTERILSGRGNVHTDDNGNPLRMSGTGQDVTEIKIAEAVIIAAKQAAEESSLLKETFLSNMSHEIRTPLNAIIGFTEILRKSDLGAQEKEYLKTIEKAGESLSTIINDILEISKIEAGMIDFEERPLSIKEILKSLKAMLAQKAKEKNIELSFECHNEVPDILLGDPTRLTQILINLIGNAIKFTQKGRVDLFVKLLTSKNEHYLIEFSVKDTGIGISEDKLKHIFQRFRQAESNITRKYGGSGLGLSISEQLIKLQGGEITVESVPNVGSTFTFTLPYIKTTQILSAFEEKQEIFFDINEVRKLKILLAEDNELNVKLIVSLFSNNGLKAAIAENGKTAVEMIQKNDYDIVLMDMEMPEMNGYEATGVIRHELKSKIPIIAMTAHAMTGEREKCLKLGMNDYIAKPINVNLLFSKIYNIAFGGTTTK